MNWRAAALLLTGVLAAPVALRAAEDAAPVVVQSAPGQFEIAAIDSTVAHAIAAAAQEGWRVLAAPLSLPDAFPSPVFVRVVPRVESPGEPGFRVGVEAGGVVSVFLRPSAVALPTLRRALVHGLLMRLAVAQQGVRSHLTVPLWLELGCAGWWQTRAEAAQLDALKQETARLAPPLLMSVLAAQRGATEPRAQAVAAVWLVTFLQAESGRAREWPQCLERTLGGEDPERALALSYPGRFGSAEERELWWQTGWHHARRVRTLPTLEAAESRAQLEGLARFVFAADEGDVDIVLPLAQVVARAGEPILAAEIVRRSGELGRAIPALHPFYRNAGLSLAEAFAPGDRSAVRRQAQCATFEQDWRDALELERATNAALDAIESWPR